MEALSNTNLFRRELKVRGKIGEPGQRDKLIYVGLMHQIREVRAAGYREDETAGSVINWMVLCPTLRGVLDTTPNLSLAHLLQFLEEHFNERSAENLCNLMTALVQSTDE